MNTKELYEAIYRDEWIPEGVPPLRELADEIIAHAYPNGCKDTTLLLDAKRKIEGELERVYVKLVEVSEVVMKRPFVTEQTYDAAVRDLAEEPAT